MQALCGLQGIFDLFNCKTPVLRVLLEPNEKMIKDLCRKMPGKVFSDLHSFSFLLHSSTKYGTVQPGGFSVKKPEADC